MFTFEGIHIDEDIINESLNDANYHSILLAIVFYIVDTDQGEQMEQFLYEHPDFFNRITLHYMQYYL
jgi:hypothetical protein